MFNWLGNTLSLTLAQFIDLPGNITSLTAINETIQAFLNTLVQAGAANTARVSFNPDENLVENILQGIYTFHILFTPPVPIRTLDLLLEFDVKGLTAFISSINLVSTT
jgi:phage tail sheath protein FI